LGADGVVIRFGSNNQPYIRRKRVAKTIDLELTRAEVEVIELEARLRVVPMNDTQLSDALKTALVAKKERLLKLRTLHAQRRPPLKRTVPQRPPAKPSK
jgi:hypothetical protein